MFPNLASLGLGLAAKGATGRNPLPEVPLIGQYGHAQEVSRGKDTITGHWEIAGVPLLSIGDTSRTPFRRFRNFLRTLMERCGLPGFLSMVHASGTQVIEDFGEDHVRTGKPIIYTSADSVIQIAAHEEHFGLERLYEVCRVARELSYPMNIGRVIARPFVGETAKTFTRTGHRKDYAVSPPSPTLLDVLTKPGAMSSRSARSATSSRIPARAESYKVSGNPAFLQGDARQHGWPGRGRFPHDQLRRLRYRVRPPPRSRGLWQGVGNFRCAIAADHGEAAGRRSSGADGRPRQ
jgi:phosphopentomutase